MLYKILYFLEWEEYLWWWFMVKVRKNFLPNFFSCLVICVFFLDNILWAEADSFILNKNQLSSLSLQPKLETWVPSNSFIAESVIKTITSSFKNNPPQKSVNFITDIKGKKIDIYFLPFKNEKIGVKFFARCVIEEKSYDFFLNDKLEIIAGTGIISGSGINKNEIVQSLVEPNKNAGNKTNPESFIQKKPDNIFDDSGYISRRVFLTGGLSALFLGTIYLTLNRLGIFVGKTDMPVSFLFGMHETAEDAEESGKELLSIVQKAKSLGYKPVIIRENTAIMSWDSANEEISDIRKELFKLTHNIMFPDDMFPFNYQEIASALLEERYVDKNISVTRKIEKGLSLTFKSKFKARTEEVFKGFEKKMKKNAYGFGYHNQEEFHQRIEDFFKDFKKEVEYRKLYEEAKKKRAEYDKHYTDPAPVLEKSNYLDKIKEICRNAYLKGASIKFEEPSLEKEAVYMVKSVLEFILSEQIDSKGDFDKYILVFTELVHWQIRFDELRNKALKEEIDNIIDYSFMEKPWIIVVMGAAHKEHFIKSYKDIKYKSETWESPRIAPGSKYQEIRDRYNKLYRNGITNKEIQEIAYRELIESILLSENNMYTEPSTVEAQKAYIDKLFKRLPLAEWRTLLQYAIETSSNAFHQDSRVSKEYLKPLMKKPIINYLIEKVLKMEEWEDLDIFSPRDRPSVHYISLIERAIATIGVGIINKGGAINNIRHDISNPEESAKLLMETLVSIGLNKKIALIFDSALDEKSGENQLKRFMEALDLLKKNKTYAVLLKNFEFFKVDEKVLHNTAEELIKDNKREVFIFAGLEKKEDLSDLDDKKNLHAAYIKNNLKGSAYYPIAEIIAITLSHFISCETLIMSGKISDKLVFNDKEVNLRDVNLEFIQRDDRALFFSLLPNAQVCDEKEVVRRYAAFKRFLKSV
ncbi:membrane protein [Candidatus Omnitrophus magneticus]|uniref:Membrane protein n=1 Tax=Candidatus Omnitrophus magneticus TaxID=1609969 RepID=A0A0F0CQ41_9BACT|nr:membrane protein [Candidatus Omnitrophus magneticus]